MVLYFQSPPSSPSHVLWSKFKRKIRRRRKKWVHFILFFSLFHLVCKKGKKKRERASLKCRFSHDRTGKFNFPKWCWICSLSRNWKKKSISFFSSSFSSLLAALMCGNSRSNSHQRNGSWLAHNSVQECRHFAEKGNVFCHKNPT